MAVMPFVFFKVTILKVTQTIIFLLHSFLTFFASRRDARAGGAYTINPIRRPFV